MKIEDGKGSGRQLEVDSKNRASVVAVVKSVEHDANFVEGKSWSLYLEQTPTACQCGNFFYFKNTGTSTYVMESFDYRVASAENVTIFLCSTGTTACGTAITPVNLNTSSARVMTATIEKGNDINGITDGTLLNKLYLTSTETDNYNFNQDLVIAPGGVVTFQAGTLGVLITMAINVYETEL